MGRASSRPFSSRFERAVVATLGAHAGQERKGGGRTPYVAHPLHVAWMLAVFVEDEDVLIAALLHDAVEDSAKWTLGRVRAEFGSRVAGIVGELSEDKSLSWEERKESAIAGVAELTEEAALVKACDKLHNLSTLVLDLEQAADRQAVWELFNGGREGTVSVARRLTTALAERVPARLARALEEAAARLEDLASGG